MLLKQPEPTLDDDDDDDTFLQPEISTEQVRTHPSTDFLPMALWACELKKVKGDHSKVGGQCVNRRNFIG